MRPIMLIRIGPACIHKPPRLVLHQEALSTAPSTPRVGATGQQATILDPGHNPCQLAALRLPHRTGRRTW